MGGMIAIIGGSSQCAYGSDVNAGKKILGDKKDFDYLERIDGLKCEKGYPVYQFVLKDKKGKECRLSKKQIKAFINQ